MRSNDEDGVIEQRLFKGQVQREEICEKICDLNLGGQNSDNVCGVMDDFIVTVTVCNKVAL